MSFGNIKNALLANRICLKSLSINSRNKLFYTAQKNSYKGNGINDISQAIYLTDLWQIWNINNSTSNQKQKIISILRHYSKNHWGVKKVEDMKIRKYIRRFQYKYHKNHKYRFKHDRHKELSNHKTDKIPIAAIYIIYKIMLAESKLSIYKKFKNRCMNYLHSDIA